VDDWDKVPSFDVGEAPRRSTSSLDAIMEHPLRADEERVLTESQVIGLLKGLCIDLGFCLPADVAEKLEANPPRTIDAFTRAVFKAEGLDPALADRRLYDQVQRAVALAFNGVANV
jgi:hypothetical protein